MYKLLTFNEDYGDEHNVPALAIMTEEEYDIWLNTPSGTLNPDYDDQLAKFEANEKLNSDFWSALKDAGYENTGKIPSNNIFLVDLERNYRKNHKYVNYPNRVISNMHAYLGNGGDYFEENYTKLFLMRDFVMKGLVKVFDVSDEFASSFKKARLDDLSLCNVFTIDEY